MPKPTGPTNEPQAKPVSPINRFVVLRECKGVIELCSDPNENAVLGDGTSLPQPTFLSLEDAQRVTEYWANLFPTIRFIVCEAQFAYVAIPQVLKDLVVKGVDTHHRFPL